MTDCIRCFKRERTIHHDGTVYKHDQAGVDSLLCGSCVQVVIKATNTIPWDGDFEAKKKYKRKEK